MDKNLLYFIFKLFGFTIVLLVIHIYILTQFFDGELQLPLWLIYLFNALLVFVVYSSINHYSKKGKDVLKVFLILTGVKMMLAVIVLLPLFLKKTQHTQLEIFNFFIPYFLFLVFEIFNINSFLQKG